MFKWIKQRLTVPSSCLENWIFDLWIVKHQKLRIESHIEDTVPIGTCGTGKEQSTDSARGLPLEIPVVFS